MWNKNAIGYHAKKITDAGWDNPEFNFFMLQGGRGVEEPNPELKAMELKAREQKKVVLINYDFSPAYYLGQQYPYGDPAKWPHFEMDWPLRKFVEMLANRSPDGVVISLLDGSDQDGKPATANWVSYAGREFITRAKKWLETNKPGLPVFIRTSHKWLKQNGAPALEWIHQHETLVEQPADEPLALDKAFPPDGSKPAYVGASTGWAFWKYHAFLILFNGSPTALAARFGASAQPEADTTPPGVPGGLGAITTADAVYLTWNAVGDAAGYHVWCDGQRVATVVTTAWSDLDLGPGSYTYQVEAFDAAGNISAKSAGLVATVSGGSSPQPVDLKPVMDMLERLEAGQAALAAAQQNLLAAVASTAKAVDEIRAHFKP